MKIIPKEILVDKYFEYLDKYNDAGIRALSFDEWVKEEF